MVITIRYADCRATDETERFIEERLGGVLEKQKSCAGSVVYECDGSRGEGLALMEELIAKFPDVAVSGDFFSDVEGRDSSWWAIDKYESDVDGDGRKYIKYLGGSVQWS